MELTEGWSYVVSRLQSFGKPCGTVEDGGVWMKSRVFYFKNNKIKNSILY